jgi:hypothetical protein
MVDFKKLVLAFMPIVASQPLLLRNQPAFAAEQHAIQPEFQIAAGIREREKKRKCAEPHERAQPEQGGERISEVWLRSISARECLWRFRYVQSCQTCIQILINLP